METVRVLLTSGIDVNQVSDLGWTALLKVAARSREPKNYLTIAKSLLDAGAIADKNKITAFQHAEKGGVNQTAELIKRYGRK